MAELFVENVGEWMDDPFPNNIQSIPPLFDTLRRRWDWDQNSLNDDFCVTVQQVN